MVLGHRRNKNLRDILVKSRIRYPPTRKLHQISGKETNVCVYTSNIRCDYCPKIDTSGKILCSKTKGTYKGPKDGTCGNNNLVYLVTCQRCQKQYVGETHRTLKERFYEHFYDCKHLSNPLNAPPSMQGKKSSGILKHFSVKPHCVNDVKIQPLEHIRKAPHVASTKKYRKTRELYWIYQLRTLEPMGLNTMENIHEILACI